MDQSWNIPWREDTLRYDYNTDSWVPVSYSGSHLERNFDHRSALVKNQFQNGWRPPSPYSREIDQGDSNVIRLSAKTMDLSRGVYHNVAGGADCNGYWYVPTPPVPVYLEDAAITKCLLNVKGMDENLAENIGTRKMTADLVVDSCKRLAGMVLHARRTALHISDPFKLWLTWKYGWQPLLGDVHSAVTKLMDEEGQPRKITVKAGGRERFYSYDAGIDSPMGTGPAFKVDRVVRGIHSSNVRLDYVENQHPALRTLCQEGLTNPLALAWELVPFSFVVDWFLPVGNFFNCLDATLGWDFLGGSCSSVTRMNYKVTNPRLSPDNTPGAWSGSCSATGKATRVKFTRKVYSSSPLPHRPYFNGKTSSTHVANGIALLGAAFTQHIR